MRMRSWRGWAIWLAYIQAAWNLLLFAVNPAWGSMVLAWLWIPVSLSAGSWRSGGWLSLVGGILTSLERQSLTKPPCLAPVKS